MKIQFLNKKPAMGVLKTLLGLMLFVLLLSSCVTKKQFDEMKEIKEYYEAEAEVADSLSNVLRDVEDERKETEAQLKTATDELEQLTVTNINLNKSYQEVLKKYDRLISTNQDVLTTSSYEKQNLQEQLTARENALDQRERRLLDLEYEINEKERRIQGMETGYTELAGEVQFSRQKIRELEAMLSIKEEKMGILKDRIDESLLGFNDSDLAVRSENGRIYLTLSQQLLFKSGSSKIEWGGKKALKQVAEILNANPDIDINVEGHTDSDGNSAKNWDLSVSRATSVVNVLVSYGVDAKRIIASGRGEYVPVANNSTSDGKAKNRRTEIILSPKLDELYDILNN